MKLLIVTQYFWPESFIINDLVATLARLGHSVTVATGKPNYPGGKIYDGYTAAGTQTQVYAETIPVVRVPVRPRHGGGAYDLFMNYVSFVWAGLRWFPYLLRGREFDAIVVFMLSPITSAIPAIWLKSSKKAHLAVWIQDLWPESLEATGFIRNSLALRAVEMIVRAIYRRADTLLVQSRAFIDPVARRSRPDKVVYFPNSVKVVSENEEQETGDASIAPEIAEVLTRYFCVVFAGNVGKAQALGTIIDAAKRIRDLDKVRILIVGSGSMSEWVTSAVAKHDLTNVMAVGRFPTASMPAFFRRAGALLVTLTDHEILSYTIPSKVQAYLSAGRPIIGSLNGEGARIISEAGAGLTCPAEDSEALAACVRALYAMSDVERAQLGRAGRNYFLEHFNMDRQAERLIEILTHRIAHSERIR